MGFLAVLPIVERLLPNIKILVFSRNGILIKSLEEDFFVKFKYLYDRLLEPGVCILEDQYEY